MILTKLKSLKALILLVWAKITWFLTRLLQFLTPVDWIIEDDFRWGRSYLFKILYQTEKVGIERQALTLKIQVIANFGGLDSTNESRSLKSIFFLCGAMKVSFQFLLQIGDTWAGYDGTWKGKSFAFCKWLPLSRVNLLQLSLCIILHTVNFSSIKPIFESLLKHIEYKTFKRALSKCPNR